MVLAVTEPGPEQVCLRPTCGVWALDSVQERFHSMRSGDSESMFTEAGHRETKEGLTVQADIGREPRRFLETLQGRISLVLAHWKVTEKGALETESGVTPGRAAAAHCSSGCKTHGDPQSLGGKKSSCPGSFSLSCAGENLRGGLQQNINKAFQVHF